MPNIDTTGKFGRSMDYSQFLEFRRKYVVGQRQETKNPPGDQSKKPFIRELHNVGAYPVAVDYLFTRGITNNSKNYKFFTR
jgi:hypothetical protein